MKTVILHVGMHKTGSTSIQKALAHLTGRDVAYANMGRSNHSMAVYSAFSTDRANFPAFKDHGLTKSLIDQQSINFRNRIEVELARPVDRLIFSGEAICRLTCAEFREFAETIRRYDRRIHVIGYARSPVEYANSSFQQNLRRGLNKVKINRTRYRFRFEKFLDRSLVETCSIVRFDRAAFPKNSVVADFCQRLSLYQNVDWDLYMNESISEAAARVAYIFNSSMPVKDGAPYLAQARHRFMRELSETFVGDKFRLPADFFCEGSFDRNDVDWLYQTFGIDFRNHLPPASCPKAREHIFEDLSKISSGDVERYRRSLSERDIPFDKGDNIQTLAIRHFLHIIYEKKSRNASKKAPPLDKHRTSALFRDGGAAAN